MKMAKFTNNAIMTGEWKKAAKEFKLQEGHVVLFNFTQACYGGLRLHIEKLPVN